ncbi:hypothetical protein EDD18DRAFT_1343205 [Armillaria luteobubalina]|uniref:Uncharacterized protein n=1 Tax=Armillaria luteobubalina TaxID=153913 RepID=A0AA39QPJ9_9AGAR|nr:hypothetical protein EDD18DRAFT_1343205 [Armillaria luteobubalina]
MSGQLVPPVNLSPAPVASSSSSRKDWKQSPYALPVPNKPTVSSSKLFVERILAHTFIPPIIAVWAHGLSKLVFNKTHYISSAALKPHGYALPPPANLTITENPLKIEAMLKFWLHIRLPMLARLSLPLYSPLICLVSGYP